MQLFSKFFNLAFLEGCIHLPFQCSQLAPYAKLKYYYRMVNFNSQKYQHIMPIISYRHHQFRHGGHLHAVNKMYNNFMSLCTKHKVGDIIGDLRCR